MRFGTVSRDLARQTRAGLVVLLLFTVVVGGVYPAAVWTISRLGADSAEGSALTDTAGCVIGSELIGVDPAAPAKGPDPYFHPRSVGSVAAGDAFATGDPAAALPSNQGPSSELLASWIEQRRAAIAAREGVGPDQVPVDAVTGSGSGVDPDISPAYAALQVPRVARANGLSEDRVRELVAEHTEGRQWGFLGAERVTVPTLNAALGRTAPDCGSRSGG
ncbi:potassium-transporting ATPase subunit C [Nocardia higoensis]|uniref:potassium-transporting ATPase subunit C n=1 Tax=Nocardia higoensis TaxID=228599 RepID=UPI0002DC56BA|nr:potassium-transporting ATPase subunit C [Nocardia higoensis]